MIGQDMLTPKMPATGPEWELLAKGLLKAHMKLAGLTYAQLRELLAPYGLTDTEANLRNKVNRGRFSAVFFLQCLTAMGTGQLLLPQRFEKWDGAR